MKILNHKFGNDGVSLLSLYGFYIAHGFRFSGFHTKICYVDTKALIELVCLDLNGL